MTHPLIGLSIGRERIGDRMFDAVPREYAAAVLGAGGLPLVLPPLPPDMAGELVDQIDGLVLTGGGDLDPSNYGADRHPATDLVDPERDAFELALVAVARLRELPVLGICRGAQLLNVAFGGSLHQHLESGPAGPHQQDRRRNEAVHTVDLEPGCLLADLAGTDHLVVNSIHHQGIDRVGETLRVVGTAEDGVVEVLESADRSALAVQWHPECLVSRSPNDLLFRWIVDRARHHAESRHQ